MKEIDARGLSCPEPVMLTIDALKTTKETFKVLVSEPHQKMNVEKYARDYNRESEAVEKDGYFEVVIK